MILSPQAIMLGAPPVPQHQPDPIQIANWMSLQETLGATGFRYVRDDVASLPVLGVAQLGDYALVINNQADAGVYERLQVLWQKVADLPYGLAQAGAIGINTQTVEVYQPVAADAGRVITMDYHALNTIELSNGDQFFENFAFVVMQLGSGTTEISVPEGLGTLNGVSGGTTNLSRHSSALVIRRSAFSWLVMGGIEGVY